MNKLARKANVCYNLSRNIVVSEDAVNTFRLVANLLRRSTTMNTLPPHAQDGNTPVKRCPKCKEFLPATLNYFHSAKNNRDGFAYWCKTCRATYNKVPPEKNRVTQRKYDAAHTDEKKQYRKTDVYNTTDRNAKARRRGAVGKHTAQDVQDQIVRQKHKCYWCNEKLTTYHVDHIVPLSRGGSNDPSNLVAACPSCNLRKKDKLPHEWIEGGRLL